MRLPTFSRVTSLEDARARGRRASRCTAGSLVWLSKPGCASVRWSPVSTTWRLTITGAAAALDGSARRRTAPGPAAGVGGAASALLVDHAHLERRGAAEDVLRLGGVLHAGQLHHDAVGALLLDHRLGHAELVDAVVQRGDVLLQRAVLDALRAPRA